MPNFFIYGVPGAGKTHISRILGEKLKLTVIEGDSVKSNARNGKTKRDHPFLFLGTYQAYQRFGELNRKNIIAGCIGVRDALGEAVENEIKQQHMNVIFEGAFIDPQTYVQQAQVILIVVRDEKLHKNQFYTHREKLFDIYKNEFKAARILQEYLIEEAEKLGVTIVENNPDVNFNELSF